MYVSVGMLRELSLIIFFKNAKPFEDFSLFLYIHISERKKYHKICLNSYEIHSKMNHLTVNISIFRLVLTDPGN